jgi:Fe2+ or Zn2+ uptake regulation protein
MDLLPTGHLVCEACGRIARSPIATLTQEDLAEVAAGSPEGWQVRAVSVSFAGTCPNCQRATPQRRS